jgi:diguanylate cyclase (GGDEF)-like protein
VDLDNFKVVNDSLGHEAGDALLVAVAERLRECLRPEDTLARLSGDEFTVLLEDVEGTSDATVVAQRMAVALRAPFVLEGQEAFVTVSIGTAFGDSSQESPGSLLRNADLAMYRAKETGKARHEVFRPEMNERALKRLSLEGELRRALERDELRVYYQPQVLLNTELQEHLRASGRMAIVAQRAPESSRIVGMEALVRWEHPERGLLSPDEFVPFAEENGLIVSIGRWVLEQACRQAKEWQEQHSSGPHLTMSVNVSAAQFRSPELIEDVARVLQETGLEAGMLTLEITESVLLEEAQANADTLEQLKALGVRLAVDDFGTGYSSLSYLKRLPVDYLKIDRSFVTNLGQDSQDRLLVSGVIYLAHGLGLKVIAEGVESPRVFWGPGYWTAANCSWPCSA